MTPLKPLTLTLALLLGSSVAAQAAEPLLLVQRNALLHSPPSQAVPGQAAWDMHHTAQSRTRLVRLDAASPALQAEGERTVIVLDGQVRFSFGKDEHTLGSGDYVAIPGGQPYRMQPDGPGSPLLLVFDVPGEVAADARPMIREQARVMAGPTSWNDPSDRGWTLARTAHKRVNLVEMFAEAKNHSHPDADHSLILLKGRARVVTPDEAHVLEPGDYVSIPRNVAHKYYVEGSEPALFISFDAPAYDPAKTVYLE
ncbi:cupin domain-containing protein [Pseudomonas sp. 148P]|uniref:Cupin domain-containing protein n=1 Tax=Pseudomonas ulcerans TaxID=3115852 RepID=A0ABU7HZU6_9PSED|nr:MULTISPECIES: cupin domain-containing protein [unclassified Pseudomonas]MEE1925580.1 cupin domain-containing protein [Pseudomonas sp. 147P]MEE1937016.1 cupin domain-containing protein [Pseudomonas sp. 148P]